MRHALPWQGGHQEVVRTNRRVTCESSPLNIDSSNRKVCVIITWSQPIQRGSTRGRKYCYAGLLPGLNRYNAVPRVVANTTMRLPALVANTTMRLPALVANTTMRLPALVANTTMRLPALVANTTMQAVARVGRRSGVRSCLSVVCLLQPLGYTTW